MEANVSDLQGCTLMLDKLGPGLKCTLSCGTPINPKIQLGIYWITIISCVYSEPQSDVWGK